jgi:hypothetical protein
MFFSALFFAAILACVGFAASSAHSAERWEDAWLDETGKILAETAARGGGVRHGSSDYHDSGEVGVELIEAIGAPVYRHLLARVSEESSYALTFFGDKMPRIIVGELSKMVPFGGVRLEFDDFRSDEYAMELLAEASEFLPARWLGWIKYLNRGQAIVAGRASRGRYSRGRVEVNNLKTAVHELVHAYEDKPFVTLEDKLRLEFYERRTKGKKLRNLSRITNLYFYEKKEKYRAGFVYRYLGKERGEELMSEGIECLLWNRFDIWNRDPELTKYLLGMLIFFGQK